MPPLVASDGFARAYPEGLREMAQISSPSSLTKSIKTLERLELSVLVWTYFLAQKLVMSAFPFPKDMFFQDLILFSQAALRSILGRKQNSDHDSRGADFGSRFLQGSSL